MLSYTYCFVTGALRIVNGAGPVSLTKSEFLENRADLDGGAIRITDREGSISVTRSDFTNNIAASDLCATFNETSDFSCDGGKLLL